VVAPAIIINICYGGESTTYIDMPYYLICLISICLK
jgi:hypothetical protein